MFEKYKIIREHSIVSGQDAKSKEWYCKELPAYSTKETEKLIGELNKIYNSYNKKSVETKKKIENNETDLKKL